MSLEIRYIDAPEGVQEGLTASSTGGSVFSDPASVPRGGPDAAWATLEPGVWVLDGSRRLLPDDPEPGWWSAEPSGPDGSFAVPPVLELALETPCSATGFTFTFSPSTGQWCSRIRLSWYNGATLLRQGVYFPDGPEWVLEQTVESFDRIRLELLAASAPGQFAKLRQLVVGQLLRFGPEELERVQLVNEADPTLCVLSADTLSVTLMDRKGRNLIPQENQRMELYRDGKLRAVSYVVSGNRKGRNVYQFSCQSVIGLLEDTFLGGMYDRKPLAELVAEILGERPFALAPDFRETTVSGYLGVCTQRQALQQLAFAAGAVITTQDSDKIRFNPLPTAVTGTFGPADIFLGASVRTEPRVSRVEVTAHSYSPSEEEVTLLQDEEITGEDVLITFDTPHHSYTITGGQITASDVNWVRVSAEGCVTLTGKTYLHSCVVHSRRNPMATARELGNTVSVPDVTLIHGGNGKQALDRLYGVCLLRQTAEQEAVVRGQRAGDSVASVTPWNTRLNGYITSMDMELTRGASVAKVVILGMEAAVEGVYLHSGELFAGGTEVVY